MRGKSSIHRTRALGLAAIRETAEESGILLGTNEKFSTSNKDWELFQNHNVSPSLSSLRLFSRAITPPGLARRFDTWFFVAPADAIGFTPRGGFNPSGELEELKWITPQEAIASQTREITRVMLVELMHRMEKDPHLNPSYPAPYYYSKRNRFFKQLM